MAPTTDVELLSIGQLAERTSLSVSTLRAWEQRVGFPEPVRTKGGQRRYRAGDVALVERVQLERDRGLSLEDAVAGVRRSREVGEDSLYAVLRRDHPDLDVITVSAATMLALTWSIEDECLVQASHPLLMGCFQDQASYHASSGRRWRELARSAAQAVVFADFEESAPDETPARVALPEGSPMLNEWSLLCLDPHVAVALVGWERPRELTAGKRRFEAVLSTQPAVVHAAVEQCAGIARAAGVDWSTGLAASLASGAGTAATEARAVSLLRRFASYSDERVR